MPRINLHAVEQGKKAAGPEPGVQPAYAGETRTALELYVTSLRLHVHLGTGYSWSPALPDIIEHESVMVKGGVDPGAAEVQIFRFRSTTKGNGELVLANVRPWEKPEQPLETFTLNMAVE